MDKIYSKTDSINPSGVFEIFLMGGRPFFLFHRGGLTFVPLMFDTPMPRIYFEFRFLCGCIDLYLYREHCIGLVC